LPEYNSLQDNHLERYF